MRSPESKLPETRERRCPGCASEAITPANHLRAIHTMIKEEFLCGACRNAFWIVQPTRA